MGPLAAFALATFLALLLTPLGVRLAWVSGYLDHPEARKLHTAATPLLGGMVVFVAAIAGWLIVTRAGVLRNDVVCLLLGAIVALGVGLWDDRFGMSIGHKLVGQVAAAGFLLASGNVPDLGLPVWLEMSIVIFCLVGLMNAVNFLDNMNGVIAGLSAIALAGFAVGSWDRGAYGLATGQLALAGACAGFLRYNFPRARIFLGDAGSLFLGYSLGASAVLAWTGQPQGWGRLAPLLMVGYPLFDLIFVVVTRAREKRGIHVGGKDHTNHRLATLIGCQKRTVILVWLAGAGLCASALAAQRLNQALPTLGLSAFWVMLFLLAGIRLSSVPVAPNGHPRPSAASDPTASR
jgi:UDP-GlcNAc:undecaprenyl-phosphate/decaprenyl-phosphate GlcNAc-1-phosphate transferase